MASRLELHELLKGICKNVYFQAPPSVMMKYPAIRYKISDIQNTFADNEVYTQSHVYELTVIDPDPDSEIVDKISKLPTCRFNRNYAADNLNHTVFLIHF